MGFIENKKEIIDNLVELLRHVYEIDHLKKVDSRKDKKFVQEVLRDLRNITYKLAIADHVISPGEVNIMIAVVGRALYGEERPNPKIAQRIRSEFKGLDDNSLEIESPIYSVEQAKKFDAENESDYASKLRDAIDKYAQAVVDSDGFMSANEYSRIEAFRLWLYD